MFRERRKKALETAVATLLLLTASVVFACVVVDLAVNTAAQTLNTSSYQQIGQLKQMESRILNETGIFNGTAPQLTNSPLP